MGFIHHLDTILEYSPILLILMYGMTELRCQHLHKAILCKFVFVLLLWLIFYTLVHKMGVNKDLAFIITCLLWMVSTYIRRTYLFPDRPEGGV